MNRKQPDGAKGEQTARHELSGLHSALKQAGIALNLSDAVSATGAALLNRIPRDAATPTSPASVASLASERGCDPRTIRNHINRLIACGLAEDRTLDGGHRHCQRDCHGNVIAIFGIDFSQLVERAPEMAAHAERIRLDQIEHTRLRHDISRIRRAIRPMIETHHADPQHRRTWAALPRRIAGLGLEALRLLITRVQELHDALAARGERTHGRKQMSDRSEKIDRPHTTYQDLSEFCNPAIPAEKEKGCERAYVQPTCGLEHVTLNMAIQAAPDDWRTAMQYHGGPSWQSLVAVACERGEALNLHPSAWAQAQAALGRAGAALLVLLADAQGPERGGRIQSPGGWVRRMSERAETGTAHLHRSVFGLLHRQETA